jgi:hypothetical protein
MAFYLYSEFMPYMIYPSLEAYVKTFMIVWLITPTEFILVL